MRRTSNGVKSLRERLRAMTWRRGLTLTLSLALLLWALAPAVRAFTLVGNWPRFGSPPAAEADLSVRVVSFPPRMG